MIDFSKFLGIPYKRGGRDMSGLDCYGLMKVLSDEQENSIPDYATPDDQSLIYQLVNSEKELFEKLDKPESGCYVVFSLRPYHFHFGMVIGENKFIHILEKKSVVIERLDNWLWSKKIVGFYRWNK